MENSHSIELQNLHFRWPGDIYNTIEIDTWQLAQGERCFVYGRSGSGKTTLLNIVAGILQPQQGKVSVCGQEMGSLKPRQRDRLRAKQMGVIFQQFNLIPYLSIKDNIKLSHYFSQTPFDDEQADHLIAQLELPNGLLHKKATELSVGQQQRVAVARALSHKPSLIIADEPTSALDTETRDRFIELLLHQCQQTNCTVVFVSHDQALSKHFDQSVDLHILNQARSE